VVNSAPAKVSVEQLGSVVGSALLSGSQKTLKP